MHAAGRVESVSTELQPVPARVRGAGRHSAEQLEEAAHILATLAEVPQRASA